MKLIPFSPEKRGNVAFQPSRSYMGVPGLHYGQWNVGSNDADHSQKLHGTPPLRHSRHSFLSFLHREANQTEQAWVPE